MEWSATHPRQYTSPPSSSTSLVDAKLTSRCASISATNTTSSDAPASTLRERVAPAGGSTTASCGHCMRTALCESTQPEVVRSTTSPPSTTDSKSSCLLYETLETCRDHTWLAPAPRPALDGHVARCAPAAVKTCTRAFSRSAT
eukprot:scaffold25633_cov63-Phaeocystis_antarctica.AAC.1